MTLNEYIDPAGPPDSARYALASVVRSREKGATKSPPQPSAKPNEAIESVVDQRESTTLTERNMSPLP
jgi:hypothetical protein